MKCETAQLEIMLLESDELSKERTADLELHLQDCASCRESHAEQLLMISQISALLPGGEPSGDVVERIIEKARTRNSNGWKALLFPQPALRAIAYAALLVIMAGGVWFTFAPEHQPESEFSEMAAIINMISEEGLFPGESDMVLSGEGGELDMLAEQLLHLQGFSEKIFDLKDYYSIPDEEPDPTTSQSHSTHALQV